MISQLAKKGQGGSGCTDSKPEPPSQFPQFNFQTAFLILASAL